MELSPAELKHRIAGLSRPQRRSQARQSWNLLALWTDKEYAHMSRQAARAASWKAYWAMWREDYQPPVVHATYQSQPVATPWYKQAYRELKQLWSHV